MSCSIAKPKRPFKHILEEKKKLKNILNAIFVLQDYKDYSAVTRRKYIKEPQEC